MLITIEQLRVVMPRSGKRAELFMRYIDQAMAEFGINEPQRIIAFLATLCVESGQLVYMEELASGAAYDTRVDLGNTKAAAIEIASQHGSTPGKWWKGHGPIQITGYDNHRLCGIDLDLDLLNNPKFLTQPEHGCRSAGWFWKRNNLNKWADAEDWDGVRDVVNRGHKTAKIGDANGFQEFLHAVARGAVAMM